jgi:hypothetical protein
MNHISAKSSTLLWIAVGMLGGGLAYAFMAPQGPPRAVVDAASRRIVAAPGEKELVATYRVTNRGGRDLVFGEVKTSCGCSVASIEPNRLKPGESGVVTVKGSPLNAGENAVEIRISTNAEPDPELVLQLTMIGSAKVPYVAFHSGSVRYGVVRSADLREPIRVETRENQSARPWIKSVTCNLPGVEVKGGMQEELPLGQDVVFRRYEYQAELKRVPEPGEIRGEITFLAQEREATPVLTLPVGGTVRAAVFAAPSALYASFNPKAESPKLQLSIVADDEAFPLNCQPEVDGIKELRVRQISSQAGRVTFEVSPGEGFAGGLSTKLKFKTNHPNSPTIVVPTMLSASEG